MIHQINIFIHVTAGLLALLIGIVPLISQKGGVTHRKYGKIFLGVYLIVITTAITGALLFQIRPFLIVITVFSFYNGFSGWRMVQTKMAGSKWTDFAVAVFVLLFSIWFVIHLHTLPVVWDKTVIYFTIGAVFTITLYDIFRFLLPHPKNKKLWLYEHVYKMVSAYVGLLSAFSGTVLDFWQPYSQMVPSVIGFGCIFFYWYMLSKKFSGAKVVQ